MRATEFLTEGRNHPIIVVDVQPEYAQYARQKCAEIVRFVSQQTGPVLMFVNADETGMSIDNVEYDIVPYWEEAAGIDHDRLEDDPKYNGPIDWNRFTIIDKGYGYLRSWMDHGIPESIIVKTIRLMYQQKVNDTRDLEFPGNIQQRTPEMSEIMGAIEEMNADPMTVGWTSVAQLKRFNGAYIVGGGRNECLREVELLMNAFNIKYKRIDSLVYG